MNNLVVKNIAVHSAVIGLGGFAGLALGKIFNVPHKSMPSLIIIGISVSYAIVLTSDAIVYNHALKQNPDE